MTVQLCTPCQNYEDDYLGIDYVPNLDVDETCGRCGCTSQEEIQEMGLDEWLAENVR